MPLKNRISRSRSIRFRLTRLYVTIFAATLILFSASLYSAVVWNRHSDFDEMIREETALLVKELRSGTDLSPFSADGDALTETRAFRISRTLPFFPRDLLIQVARLNGSIVLRSKSLEGGTIPVFQEKIDFNATDQSFFSTIDQAAVFGMTTPGGSAHYRVFTQLVRSDNAATFILQVAAPLNHVEREDLSLMFLFVLGIPIALILASVTGLYLAGRALWPVSEILQRVQKLKPDNLSERIPIPTADDELKQLSLTLNSLLERLELAFASQERFIADASHELKTPLAILHSELDGIETKKLPADVSAAITSAAQESHHLIRLVEDLLLLARIGAGSACLVIQNFRVDELILETVARLERVAKQKNVRLRCNFELLDEGGKGIEPVASGDAFLLQVLFKNLIDNAIKYSPAGSTIEIEACALSTGYLVTVDDHGPGIAAHDLNRIFDRFYRATSTSSIPGTGLGLAICKRIADIHEIELTVDSQVGLGTRFRTILKKA